MHNDNGDRIQRSRRKDDREHQCGESARQADNQKASAKKSKPEMKVPAIVMTAAGAVFTLFFTKSASARNRNAVTGFSMIFGSCPPGKDVVSAEMIPVTIPIISTFCTRGITEYP